MAVVRKREVIAEPEMVSVNAGAFAWVMQRVTAGVLLVFLGAHLWALHYGAHGEHIRLEAVMQRLSSPFYIATDLALLAAGIYHALNGVRMVFFDFGFGRVVNRTFDAALCLFGLAAFVYGGNTLLYLMTGRAIFYLNGG